MLKSHDMLTVAVKGRVASSAAVVVVVLEVVVVMLGEGGEARERKGEEWRGEERRGGGRGKLQRHVRAIAAMAACVRIFPCSEIRSEQSPEV